MKSNLLLLLLLSLLFFYSCSKDNSVGKTVYVTPAATYLNISYGQDPLQTMDVYLPAGRNSDSTKVIILAHGGAWISGDKADFDSFVDTLKSRIPTYAIFNINYRLSAYPLNVFPTQEMDIKAAVEFINSKRASYLISDKFVMMGGSAGAHLSLLEAYKYNSPVKIRAVVDFFGPTDLLELYNNPGVIPATDIAAVIGATPTSNPALYQSSSPINFVTASAACPTIILQGSADPLVNATSQSEKLKNQLQVVGIPVQYILYDGLGHGTDWTYSTYKDAFNNIQAFLALYNP